jgi:hypothetical protein
VEVLSAISEHTRQLLPIQRSVLHENRAALLRRWRLVRAGALEDPRLISRWFPRQRELLDLLDCLSEEEVETMAHVGHPLFGVSLRCTDFSLDACAAFSTSDALERDSVQESFLALGSRLDAARCDKTKACSTFNMTAAEADWLQRFCPLELHNLARDPSMVLAPIASAEYFMVVATKKLSYTARTLMAIVSRRQPSLA